MHAPVGVGAILLAVVGLIAPWAVERFRRPLTKNRIKRVSIIATGLLLALELWSIKWDGVERQKVAEQTLCEERETLAATKDATSLAKESLENITGGKSFVVLQPMPTIGRWSAVAYGTSNRHNVVMNWVDAKAASRIDKNSTFEQVAQIYHPVQLGEIATGSSIFVNLPFSSTQPLSLNIFFSAMNGFWTEAYRMEIVDGKPAFAIQVFRSNDKDQTPIFQRNPG